MFTCFFSDYTNVTQAMVEQKGALKQQTLVEPSLFHSSCAVCWEDQYVYGNGQLYEDGVI